MNIDLKTKWIAALRSGEYPQGRGYLRTGTGYCCLGVLCDLYHKETGLGSWILTDGIGEIWAFHGSERIRFTVYPPRELMARVGAGENDVTDLARMNDSGKSFSEIADWIESHIVDPKSLLLISTIFTIPRGTHASS